MPSIVIVTRQCYLLCESINYIVINEAEDDTAVSVWLDKPKKNRRTKKIPKSLKQKNDYINYIKPYQIHIDFIPTGGVQPNGNSGNGSLRTSKSDTTTRVSITVQGLERCAALFQEMVAQIREQIPDQVFLDKLIEKFLIGSDK
jgi:hypothetical protein